MDAAAPRDVAAMESLLVSIISSCISDALRDGEARQQQKKQCSERLRCDGDGDGRAEYAEQAVLANLDWGIDAIEEVILHARNEEARCARLEYAEKMLQVCARLEVSGSTAGVPNAYLSAWAHLNLARVWKLRDDNHTAAQHVMEMFAVEPFFSRVDFAPAIWMRLFLPNLTAITAWYCDQRRQIFSSLEGGDSCGHMQADDEGLDPDEAELLQQLERLYHDSLDDHTRRFAEYFREQLRAGAPNKWSGILLPIAEPPLTPWKELGDSRKLLKKNPTSLKDPVKDSDLSPVEDDSKFSHNRQSSMSALHTFAKDHFLTLTCNNPMWEDDRRDNSFSMTKRSLNKIELPKGGLLSISSYSFAPTDQDGTTQTTSPVFALDKRTQNLYCSDSQEKDQQSSFEFSTISNSLGMSKEINPDLRSLCHSQPFILNHNMESTKGAVSHSSTMRLSNSYERNNSLRNNSFRKHMKLDIGDNVEDAVMKNSFKQGAQSLYFGGDDGDEANDDDDDDDDDDEERASMVTRPPKDFVCPITGHLFKDPVTLDTGQTYERKAIQKWLDNGNTTCPITRQNLKHQSLPKTNYVLKRLVLSWKENHMDIAEESSSIFSAPQTTTYSGLRFKSHRHRGSTESHEGSPCSNSSTSTIYQETLEHSNYRSSASPIMPPEMGLSNYLENALSFLCKSNDLEECEESLLNLKDRYCQAKWNLNLEKYSTKVSAIDALIEILRNSESADALKSAIYMLSELLRANEFVRASILNADPNLKCILQALKRGISGAVVLLHQLKPPFSLISSVDVILDLIKVLREKNFSEELPLLMPPKPAALKLMRQAMLLDKSSKPGIDLQHLVSLDLVRALINSLDTKTMEDRLDVVMLLLFCMQEDGGCRECIAQEADLDLVLEICYSKEIMLAISFFSELVRLSRRTVNNHILQIVKTKGMMSSMHVLLAHLQRAPPEQRTLTAGLLLQINFLERHCRPNIFRDEAVEALIESLNCKESLDIRVEAAEMLVALVGHFSSSGKPLTEALLLKTADLEEGKKEYMEAIQSEEWIHDKVVALEEEKAQEEWEKGVAKGLLCYEQGSILPALAHNMRSKTSRLSWPCMIFAVWLLMMVPRLPNTGIARVAHHNLFGPFLAIFKSAQNTHEQVLSALALHGLLQSYESVKLLAAYAKDLSGPLKKLKRLTWVAKEIFEMIAKDPSVDVIDIWENEKIGEIDLHKNGAIKAFASAKGQIFSGHSDGTIKVWDVKNALPIFVHETKRHSKSITALAVSQSKDKLYSGSLDGTIRVWILGQETISCKNVLEQKEPVNGLIVNGSLIYVIPQGAGLQVRQENTTITKTFIEGKYIQSVSYSDGKIYCGCIDNSIQEVDVSNGSSLTIQPRTRTFIGKSPIYALKVLGNNIYSAGAPVDGKAVKIWSKANRNAVAAITSAPGDIRAMAVSDEFIYLGTRSGVIEVWLQDKLLKVASFNIGSKVTCFLLEENLLLCGSRDGKIHMFWQ